MDREDDEVPEEIAFSYPAEEAGDELLSILDGFHGSFHPPSFPSPSAEEEEEEEEGEGEETLAGDKEEEGGQVREETVNGDGETGVSSSLLEMAEEEAMEMDACGEGGMVASGMQEEGGVEGEEEEGGERTAVGASIRAGARVAGFHWGEDSNNGSGSSPADLVVGVNSVLGAQEMLMKSMLKLSAAMYYAQSVSTLPPQSRLPAPAATPSLPSPPCRKVVRAEPHRPKSESEFKQMVLELTGKEGEAAARREKRSRPPQATGLDDSGGRKKAHGQCLKIRRPTCRRNP